jgi:hypothetical protein
VSVQLLKWKYHHDLIRVFFFLKIRTSHDTAFRRVFPGNADHCHDGALPYSDSAYAGPYPIRSS